MAKHAAGGDSDIDWNTDDELEIDNFRLSPSPGPADPSADSGTGSSVRSHGAGSSKSDVIDRFVGMGFREEMVIKAIQEKGEDNMNVIADTLLGYAVADEKPRKQEEDFGIDRSSDDDESPNQNYSDLSDPALELDKFRCLTKMGFTPEDASTAIERCGEDAEIVELTDFICAAEIARQSDEFYAEPSEEKPRSRVKRRGNMGCGTSRGRRQQRSNVIDHEPIRLPNPMIGFGVPNEPGLITHRYLPEAARGPPYFYYENVALAPKGVWDIISSHLYGVEPEFVDSKYFCAAARKRGYIHNLPINDRFPVYPPPKYTIFEAFPMTERWWPSWDTRVKFNCLTTRFASAKVTDSIRRSLEKHEGVPPPHVQKSVIEQCKMWNLVWVGRNKVATLEPDEMEYLLGFPRNHTRGGGINRTDRYKSLGNTFQVDTVAYHLSVLKELFPDGIKVLSLFSGIGGAEVALHRLEIPMKVVVSVEISEVNRNIVKSFWEQTEQKGDLIDYADVEELDDNTIEALMRRYGGFDLVIGGSPCNNLAGSNRVSRVGLEGKQSRLFYDYARILKTVRNKAAEMRRENIINID